MEDYNTLSKIAGICNILYKLRVAGFDKRSISPMSSMANERIGNIKYVVRLAVVSLSIEYLVLVPYNQRNTTYDFPV